MFIRELPQTERPREKLMNHGLSYLSNAELIAVLLRTGTKSKSALDLAAEILSIEENGILFLSDCAPEQLAQINGVGTAKACQILAGIELGRRISTKPRDKRARVESPQSIVSLFMEEMRYFKKEVFNILLLNTKGEIIGIEKIAVGDLSCTIIHPREVFLPAIKRSAAVVAFVHNHPSGDPTPSKDDIDMTRKLVEAGKIVGVAVWDHVVIGDGRYCSFKEEQLIQ